MKLADILIGLPELPPEELAKLAHKPAAFAGNRDHVEWDDPFNVERGRTYLASEVAAGRVATEFVDGNSTLHRIACQLRDYKISEAKAREIIWSDFNPHCRPPWIDDDATFTAPIASAYHGGAQNKEPGRDAVGTPDRSFGQTSRALETSEPATKDDTPRSFYDLIEGPPAPRVQEIVPGLIERGIVTFLSAPGGTHKSRLALQWGLCVGTGTAVYERPVIRATFVHLSYEDHRDEITRRSQKIAARLKLPKGGALDYWDKTVNPEPLAIVTEDAIKPQPFWNRLRAYLLATPGPKFIVADSTYNILRFTGQAKINEAAVKAAIEMLGALCAETDSTMLVLWHPSQAGQDRGDASGWSVAWHNSPRARLSLAAVKDTEDAFELKVEKRNNGPKGKPLTLHWSDGVLVPMSDIAVAEQGSLFLEACIRVALQAAEHGTPIQRQKRLYPHQLDQIEGAAGRRPTDREVKEGLERAIGLRRLRYQKGTNRTTAGYYPFGTAEDFSKIIADRQLGRA